MRVGLIDVDGHNYPNLVLMKLSAWHKAQGDHVEWYQGLISGHMDKVYMSKVFSFTPDYMDVIDADEVVRGGSGYHISVGDGKEVWRGISESLPYEIEHTRPDTELYGITDTAYGFLTRGCPRRCGFCIVKNKDGVASRKVADLSEFWHGQKNIELLDPNILASPDRGDLLDSLIDSGAQVNFNQGLDARLLTEEIVEKVARIRIPNLITFAWDTQKDEERVLQGLRMWLGTYKKSRHHTQVYVLCNYDTDFDYDLYRVETLKSMGLSPFVMIYNKQSLKRGDKLFALANYANNRFYFHAFESYKDYLRGIKKKEWIE